MSKSLYEPFCDSSINANAEIHLSFCSVICRNVGVFSGLGEGGTTACRGDIIGRTLVCLECVKGNVYCLCNGEHAIIGVGERT